METPLHITFHDIAPSPTIEEEIRKRVARMEKRFGNFISCRVSIQALHHQHRTGNVIEAHIEINLPGRTIAVSREPHHVSGGRAKGDVLTPLRDSFKAAEAQLRDFKEIRKGGIKVHAPAVPGRVSELHPDEQYGYLTTSDGTLLYFHRNSVMQGEFEKLQLGDSVQFVEAMGDTGPTASKVWPA